MTVHFSLNHLWLIAKLYHLMTVGDNAILRKIIAILRKGEFEDYLRLSFAVGPAKRQGAETLPGAKIAREMLHIRKPERLRDLPDRQVRFHE